MILSILIFVVLAAGLFIAVAGLFHLLGIGRSESAALTTGCIALVLAVVGALVATNQIHYRWLGGARDENAQAAYRAGVQQLERELAATSGANDDMTRSGILIIEQSPDSESRMDLDRMKLVPEELRAKAGTAPRYAIVIRKGESQVGVRYGAGAGPLMKSSITAELLELPSKASLRMAFGKRILNSRTWVRLPKRAVAELIENAACLERAMRNLPSARVSVIGCSPAVIANLPLEEGTEISASKSGDGFSSVLRRNGESFNIVVRESSDEGGCSKAEQSLDTRMKSGLRCSLESFSAQVNGKWMPMTSDRPTRAVAFESEPCMIEVLGVAHVEQTYNNSDQRQIRFESGGIKHEIACQRTSDAAWRMTVTRGAPGQR